jgi:hypothetical protein
MKRITIGILLATLFAFSGAVFAQHEHHEDPNPTGKVNINPDEIGIFCATMKTGQLCSSGTTNILKLKGDQAQQWVLAARKYNKAVNDATTQLFKDADPILTPEQQNLLKAWFAVGLNPKINELLYAQGLGPTKIPATAEKK